MSAGSAMNLEHCTMSYNEGAEAGGAVIVQGEVGDVGTLSCINSSISHNRAQYGGAVLMAYASAQITSCTMFNNYAYEQGGGIFIDASVINFDHVNMSNNVAGKTGGAAKISAQSVASFSNVYLTENKAGYSGGGLVIEDGSIANLTDTHVVRNIASQDAAIVNVTMGACAVTGTCFYSPSYPSNYGNEEACELVLAKDTKLDTVSFDTESCFDFLTLEGVIFYSGSDGPSNLEMAAGSVMTFASDHHVVGTGFQICSVSNGNAANMGLFLFTSTFFAVVVIYSQKMIGFVIFRRWHRNLGCGNACSSRSSYY